MCFRPRNNSLHSRDDPDYDPDPISGLQSVSRAYMKLLADVCLGSSSENPLHFGDTRDPDYSHVNLGGGLQLLTDCLVIIIIQHFDDVNAQQSPKVIRSSFKNQLIGISKKVAVEDRDFYICQTNIISSSLLFLLFSESLYFIILMERR